MKRENTNQIDTLALDAILLEELAELCREVLGHGAAETADGADVDEGHGVGGAAHRAVDLLARAHAVEDRLVDRVREDLAPAHADLVLLLGSEAHRHLNLGARHG